MASFIANPDRFDAMISYEALMIDANEELVRLGQPSLYVVCPANGMAVADSPLAYVSKGDVAKEEAFLALQVHLLSEPVQQQLLGLGRCAGLIGLAGGGDASVWNPEWRIDLDRPIAPIPTPEQAVILDALTLYQTELRKPSLTVWVLDVSGSMEGEPLAQLKGAMRLLLDPADAALNLLQPTSRDMTVVIPLNKTVRDVWVVDGSDPAGLAALQGKVDRLEARWGADLYYALGRGMEQLKAYGDRGDPVRPSAGHYRDDRRRLGRGQQGTALGVRERAVVRARRADPLNRLRQGRRDATEGPERCLDRAAVPGRVGSLGHAAFGQGLQLMELSDSGRQIAAGPRPRRRSWRQSSGSISSGGWRWSPGSPSSVRHC